MRKLNLILAISLISLIALNSCNKDKPEKTGTGDHTVTFSGWLSTKGKATINGVQKSLKVAYKCKKGDKLVMTDTGDDIYHPAVILYSSDPTKPNIVSAPSYTTEYETSGYIILDGVIVASQEQLPKDMNISYTVK